MGLYRGIWGHIEFPKLGYRFGGTRIIVYCGLYWGPAIYGSYHVGRWAQVYKYNVFSGPKMYK